MTPAPPPDPLWRYSLRLWRRPGVERACLWLQERCGADVNVLLLCCWLTGEGRPPDARFLARATAEVAAWRDEALEPLRRVRRRLERRLRGVPGAWTRWARSGTKAAELMAERVEQLVLARCAARVGPAPGPRGGGRAPDALEGYLRLLGRRPGPAAARRLAVLRAAGAAEGRARRSA